MSLQNRVDPFGVIHARSEKGTMMGNRGGRIHYPATKTLTNRRWAGKAWIICVTSFKGSKREVMGEGYTELFFLDEVTALASGHRPCFECRRPAAKAYQAAWQKAANLDSPPKVGVMDPTLHNERVEDKIFRTHTIAKEKLVSGVMFSHGGEVLVMKQDRLLQWSFSGYSQSPLTQHDLPEHVTCLTPPATIAALTCGYEPLWHETAK